MSTNKEEGREGSGRRGREKRRKVEGREVGREGRDARGEGRREREMKGRRREGKEERVEGLGKKNFTGLFILLCSEYYSNLVVCNV